MSIVTAYPTEGTGSVVLDAEQEWVPSEEHKKRACTAYARRLVIVLLLRVALPLAMCAFLVLWTGPDLLLAEKYTFCEVDGMTREKYLATWSGVNVTAARLTQLNEAYDVVEAIGGDAQSWYILVYLSLSILCILYACSSVFICRPLCLRADLDRVPESEIERTRCVERACVPAVTRLAHELAHTHTHSPVRNCILSFFPPCATADSGCTPRRGHAARSR
jgi:hypothetical protein